MSVNSPDTGVVLQAPSVNAGAAASAPTTSGIPFGYHIYDLSRGFAAPYTGILFDGAEAMPCGVLHASVVIFGSEYYFEGGISKRPAGCTRFGPAFRFVPSPFPATAITTEDEFDAWVRGAEVTEFGLLRYRLLQHNCHVFCNAAAKFLTQGRAAAAPPLISHNTAPIVRSPLGSAFGPYLERLAGASMLALGEVSLSRAKHRRISLMVDRLVGLEVQPGTWRPQPTPLWCFSPIDVPGRKPSPLTPSAQQGSSDSDDETDSSHGTGTGDTDTDSEDDDKAAASTAVPFTARPAAAAAKRAHIAPSGTSAGASDEFGIDGWVEKAVEMLALHPRVSADTPALARNTMRILSFLMGVPAPASMPDENADAKPVPMTLDEATALAAAVLESLLSPQSVRTFASLALWLRTWTALQLHAAFADAIAHDVGFRILVKRLGLSFFSAMPLALRIIVTELFCNCLVHPIPAAATALESAAVTHVICRGLLEPDSWLAVERAASLLHNLVYVQSHLTRGCVATEAETRGEWHPFRRAMQPALYVLEAVIPPVDAVLANVSDFTTPAKSLDANERRYAEAAKKQQTTLPPTGGSGKPASQPTTARPRRPNEAAAMMTAKVRGGDVPTDDTLAAIQAVLHKLIRALILIGREGSNLLDMITEGNVKVQWRRLVTAKCATPNNELYARYLMALVFPSEEIQAVMT